MEQELKNIWNNIGSVQEISIDITLLIKELNDKMKSLQKKIQIRDTTEILAAVFLIAVFGYNFYIIPILLMKISCLWLVLWSVYVIYKLVSTKNRLKPGDYHLPLLALLTKQKKVLTEQIDLLKTVPYWYVLPPFIGTVFFVLGIEIPDVDNPEVLEIIWGISILSVFKCIMIIVLAGIFAFVFRLNRRAVRKQLTPLLEDLKSIEDELKES